MTLSTKLYRHLLPGGRAGDLPEKDVPCLGGGCAAVCDSQGDGVCGGSSKLSVH